MNSNDPELQLTRQSSCRVWWLVFVVALVMGLPTMRGGFVGGDDHRLVLNHVLVNRPSLDHAIQLFGIVHRDLYQPLPLLSFQAEFAVGNLLGLFDQGIESGKWFFHLNNALLHAANTLLVWFVVHMLHLGLLSKRTGYKHEDGSGEESQKKSSWMIATVAALLFAVHPIQTEVVAWLNGRMILMSTLFGLGSLLTFHRWINLDPKTSRGWWRSAGWAIATLILVLFCSISKVRIGLPVMLGIVMLTQYSLRNRRAWALWFVCSVLVGVFVLVNVQATSDAKLFSDAATHLRGPRIVRVILSMDHYIRHLVWPVGLASYYPTPPEVYFSDRETLQACLTVIPLLVGWGWACVRFPLARWVALWFWSTIFATLPIIPARNILAADRYMYLPVIVIFWAIAYAINRVHRRWITRVKNPWLLRGMLGVATGLVVLMIGMCWHVASYYETPLKKTLRVAQVFPDVPRVWERLGWSYRKVGQYDKASECAKKELRFDNPNVQSGAYQLLGMIALDTNDSELALSYLHKAMETDPKNSLAIYRLAVAYDELDQPQEAVKYYEISATASPMHNPTLNRLARKYQQFDRHEDARKLFLQALDNNPYEVDAIMGLVELNLLQGSPESYREALARLESILIWMPDNIDARVNLGVVYNGLHKPDRAMAMYLSVLDTHPLHETALMNLAQLYLSTGQIQSALDLFRGAIRGGLPDKQQAMVTAFLALVEKRYEKARSNVEALCAFGEDGREARRYLLSALETFDAQQPGVVWTYCLTTRLLIAQGNLDAARAFIQLCEQFCKEDRCKKYIQQLKQSIPVKP